jgi:hypothetical protein
VPNSITKGSTFVRIRELVRHDDIYLHTLFIYYSNTNVMGYEYEPAEHEEIAIRKLLILFGLFAFGAFLFLAIFVFPINNLIREQITAEVEVITKDDGICVVETPDHPRGISNCKYNTGDTLIVSYTQGTEAITVHNVKSLAS